MRTIDSTVQAKNSTDSAVQPQSRACDERVAGRRTRSPAARSSPVFALHAQHLSSETMITSRAQHRHELAHRLPTVERRRRRRCASTRLARRLDYVVDHLARDLVGRDRRMPVVRIDVGADEQVAVLQRDAQVGDVLRPTGSTLADVRRAKQRRAQPR